jgi:hypothetical protein
MPVKVLTGESLFMTAFINQASSKEKCLCILIRKNFPIDLTEFQNSSVKSSFCAAKVSVGIEFSKN